MTRPCSMGQERYVANETVLKPGEVKYEDGIKIVQPTVKKEKNVYKIILDAIKNNPMKVSDSIVLTGNELCSLIKDLTGTDNIEIQADMDITCCGKQGDYNYIDCIVCIDTDGTRKDFQVAYNKEYRLLQDYKVSFSMVRA